MSRLETKPTKWHVRPARTQISLGIWSDWSESSLCAQWVAKDPSILHADSEDWSDWANARADLSLCWAHMPFCWFCHEAAHINLCYEIVACKAERVQCKVAIVTLTVSQIQKEVHVHLAILHFKANVPYCAVFTFKTISCHKLCFFHYITFQKRCLLAKQRSSSFSFVKTSYSKPSIFSCKLIFISLFCLLLQTLFMHDTFLLFLTGWNFLYILSRHMFS